MHRSFDNEGYLFTPAYSTPSTGSLESVMGGSDTNSSSTPSPTAVQESRNYFENIKNRFSGTAEDREERTHKIAYSFDLFGSSGKLCGRMTPVPSHACVNSSSTGTCCGQFQLTVASLILFGLIQLLILAVAICAIIHSIKHPSFWDISGSIIGIALLYSLCFASYCYGSLKKQRKFLIPLIFQTILLLGASCAAILIIIFTSISHEPKNSDEQQNNKIFCVVLFLSVVYQLACIIVAILLFRQTSTDR